MSIRMLIRISTVFLTLILILVLALYLAPLVSELLIEHRREVISFATCEPLIMNTSCEVVVGCGLVVRSCRGMICVSKVFYDDNYSEPPDIIFGSKYFSGELVGLVDLKNYEVRRVITANIITRSARMKSVSIEEDLGEFVLRNICITEFYDGKLTPSFNYLLNKSVKLNLLILTPSKVYCNVSGCLYSYQSLTNKSLLNYYMEALSIWGSIFENFLNYSFTSVIHDIDLYFEVFIPGDEALDSIDFSTTYAELRLPINESDLVVVVEVPKPIKVGGNVFLAFTYGNYIFLSRRSVDVIVHEVGHVLGLRHPLITEDWLSYIFHESLMLMYTASHIRRFTLGDFTGLSHIVFLLEDIIGRRQLINNLNEVGVDPENMCIILPMVKRVYIAKEIPKVLSEIISEGLVVFEIDDVGRLRSINSNPNLLSILKVFTSKYVSSY